MGVLAAIFPSKANRGPIFREQKSAALGVPDQVLEEDPTAYLGDAFFVQVGVKEDFTLTAEISDNPVEKGIDISDNINVKPDQVTLQMVQSDSPISFASIADGIATGLGQKAGSLVAGAGPLSSLAGAAAGSLAGLLRNPNANSQGLAKTCLQEFERLIRQKALITVQTGLRLYENMAIKSIKVSRTPKDGKSLMFTVELREVRIVETLTREIKQIPEKSVNNKGQSKADQGKKNGKPVNSSLLFKGTQLVSGLFKG